MLLEQLHSYNVRLFFNLREVAAEIILLVKLSKINTKLRFNQLKSGMQEQELNEKGMFPDIVTRNVLSQALCEQGSCESTPTPRFDIHNNVSLTENDEYNSHGCYQHKGEQVDREKMLEEYKQLMDMKQDNERNIKQSESELMEQDRRICEFHAMFNRNQNQYITATAQHAEIRRLHYNYKTEAGRLRIEHVSKILSSTMLSAESEEMETKLTDVFTALAEMREYNKLGREHVKTDSVAIKKVYEDVKLTNQTVEKNIEYLKDELKKRKAELIRMGITDYSKEMLKSGQTGCSDAGSKKEKIKYPDNKMKSANKYSARTEEDTEDEVDDKTKLIVEGDLKIQAKYDIRWISQTSAEQGVKQRNTKYDHNDSEKRLKKDRKNTTPGIPKPVVHPYGSAARDGSRFRYSPEEKKVVPRWDYNRLEFVPEGQKHVVMHIIHYLDFDKELIRLKRDYFEKYGVEYGQPTNEETDRSACLTIQTERENDRKVMKSAKSKKHSDADINRSRRTRESEPGNKAHIGTARTVKKYIKAKIDTGVRRSRQTRKESSPLPPLKLRPKSVNELNKSNHLSTSPCQIFSPVDPL